jgi:hypothetical protein
MTKDLRTGDRANRPTRIPIHESRDRLTVKSHIDPAFVYRVVKDKPGRIDTFLAAGYEIVTDAVQVGDKKAATPGQEGSPVKISLGRGEQGYLMRIPRDWYEEDQHAKELELQAREEQMVQTAKKETYGRLEINRGSQT